MRNKLIYGVILLVLLFSLVAGGCGGAAKGEERHALRLGTSNPPSMYYGAGVIMAATMDRYSSGNITVTCSGLGGGTPSHAKRIGAGEIEIGLTNTVFSYPGYHGISMYEGEPHPFLRTLLFWSPSPLHVVVREDSGITNFAELDGKKFSPGFLGYTSSDTVVAGIEALGIKPEFIERSGADTLSDVKDRRLVGFGKAVTMFGIPPSVQELMATTPMRLLSVTPEEKAKIAADYPYFEWFTIPAGTYPNQKEDATIFGFTIGWFVGEDMPEEVGYELIKGVNENFNDCAKVFPAWKGVDVAKMTYETLKDTGTPLHAGVVRYLREQGFDVEAGRIPPEMK
ncbi:TAXI family TRAP transporter solute-binding subunit [Chloroflexota bacterium]